MPAASNGQSILDSAKGPVMLPGWFPLRRAVCDPGGSVLNRLQCLRPPDIPAYAYRIRCGRAHDFANDLLGTPTAGER